MKNGLDEIRKQCQKKQWSDAGRAIASLTRAQAFYAGAVLSRTILAREDWINLEASIAQAEDESLERARSPAETKEASNRLHYLSIEAAKCAEKIDAARDALVPNGTAADNP